MSKKSRVIGTSDSAISKAESELGFHFPDTFCEWLKDNNGRSIEDVTVFPVFDERDTRKTWDSIVRNYQTNWKTWLDNFGSGDDFSHLLPFGGFGTGDFFCFDFSETGPSGESIVVLWSHETGEAKFAANDFAEFVDSVTAGKLQY
ncbi:MAG: SMI1/KNR4 family protein [Pyrinomonadaceae bacterium]